MGRMKNLLQKSLRQLTRFASVLFALSIPSYFLVVDWIWLKELDENNQLIAQRIEYEFNKHPMTDEKLTENIRFWNQIQPVSKIIPLSRPMIKDSLYSVRRLNPYTGDERDRFRVLKTSININNRYYALVVETNVEETEETVGYITAVTLLFFFLLVAGFWILNRRLSVKLWQPFRNTLQQVKDFQLNKQTPITFDETDTTEFAELNTALDRLVRHSIAAYKSQKEFTENASHELQTPLAILKNKLDILLQTDDLTERQYRIAEEMNKALVRSARINRNLLLLAKIENKQFEGATLLHVDTLLHQSMETLYEHFNEKQLIVCHEIQAEVEVNGDSGLTEVMINNLLINAIRYTPPAGKIHIRLSTTKLVVTNSGTQTLDPDRLYKRFSKAATTNNGSGLGLSLVQEICKFQGWTVAYRFENNEHLFSITF